MAYVSVVRYNIRLKDRYFETTTDNRTKVAFILDQPTQTINVFDPKIKYCQVIKIITAFFICFVVQTESLH